MGIINKQGLQNVKLNPSQIFALFTLPLTYDVRISSEYFTRCENPVSYEIAFDDYIRFILLETMRQPTSKVAEKNMPTHETNTFLASDGHLNENASIVNRLLLALEEEREKPSANRNFSTIHPITQDALNVMFENFLLNIMVLQARLVEFQRWDSYMGKCVPYIIPSLGVFDLLLNADVNKMEFEDNAELESEILTDIKHINIGKIPSNIVVGHLRSSMCDRLFEGIQYPDLEISYYLYRGIFRHSVPTGHYLKDETIRNIDKKVSDLSKYNKKVTSLNEELETLIRKNNKPDKDGNRPSREVYLENVINEVTLATQQNKQLRGAEPKIVRILEELKKLENDKPKELTQKEIDDKMTLDRLRSNNEYVKKYPKYTYYQHINRISEKVESGSEICKLEESILEIDTYLNLLLRIFQIVSYLYEKESQVYLLVPKIEQSIALSSETDLTSDSYNLIDLVSE